MNPWEEVVASNIYAYQSLVFLKVKNMAHKIMWACEKIYLIN